MWPSAREAVVALDPAPVAAGKHSGTAALFLLAATAPLWLGAVLRHGT